VDWYADTSILEERTVSFFRAKIYLPTSSHSGTIQKINIDRFENRLGIEALVENCEFLTYFSLKNGREVYEIDSLPICPSVCSSLNYCIPLLDFHEIHRGDHAIEGDLYAIMFNSVVLAILKWWTFELLRWI
jgi:hypothetical protein